MADIDIGQITEALNDKADRNLMNADADVSVAQNVIDWMMPDFSLGTDISSGFVATVSGWVYWRGDTSTSNVCYVDGQIVAQTGSYADQMCQFFPVGKGSTVTFTRKTTANFYPCKGKTV